MPGFDGIAGLVNFCGKEFYSCSRWLLRKKQAKGHGVHSPFAYNLITNVIYSPYSFYAFSDIYEIISRNDINPEDSITAFNHLSFRLVHYLQSGKILEINSGTGINTLFLTAPSSHIHCKCMEKDSEKRIVAERLYAQRELEVEFISSLSVCERERYDAIFINLEDGCIPDIRILAELSYPGTFWAFHPIKKGRAKQFWDEIVHNVTTRVTFDTQGTGIVFLRPDLHKEHYWV